MIANIETRSTLDADGNPTGGYVHGTGLTIDWQDGPLGREEDRKEPNGAFVETVIASVIQRIEFYQEHKFACQENADALKSLDYALHSLQARTADREARGVEGLHKV